MSMNNVTCIQPVSRWFTVDWNEETFIAAIIPVTFPFFLVPDFVDVRADTRPMCHSADRTTKNGHN